MISDRRYMTELRPSLKMEHRGLLRFWDLPFPVVRMFDISSVAIGEMRGGHAHRTCDQVFYCVRGRCDMILKTGKDQDFSRYGMRGQGLSWGSAVLVPRMTWIELINFTHDAVITVLCSEEYKPPITDFEEFLKG